MRWRVLIPSGLMAVDDFFNRITFLSRQAWKTALQLMAADGIAVWVVFLTYRHPDALDVYIEGRIY